MKRVKCISPHGGCHNGMDHNGLPVHPVAILGADAAGNPVITGSYLPDRDPATLRLPPHEGGYVDDGRIPGRYAAVGEVYEVADDFYADGFHWSEVDAKGRPTGATDPAAVPSAAPTGKEGE